MNDGVIIGTLNVAIDIAGPGYVSNSDLIEGSTGVLLNGSGTLTNTGTVIATGTGTGVSSLNGLAILVADGGNVVNTNLIEGLDGVYFYNTPGTLINSGSIIATYSPLASVHSDCDVINTGLLEGEGGVDVLFGTGTVSNSGTIIAKTDDAFDTGDTGNVVDTNNSYDGYVTNTSTGALLLGDTFGVHLYEGGTVANGGTIIGTLDGAVDIAGSGVVTNSGLLEGQFGVSLGAGSTLSTTGTIVGTGGLAVQLAAGDLLVIGATASFSGSIDLAGGSETIDLLGTSTIGAPITGLTGGDDLVFLGHSLSSDSYVAVNGLGTLTADFTDGSSATLSVLGTYDQNDFVPTGDEITVACYLQGTRIATPMGEVAIERLNIGDHAMTASGVSLPIRWIGRRSYGGRFAQRNGHELLPVCIRADALADGVPKRDLFVSPRHGMLVDGVLVPAVELVNGVTIVQVETCDEIAYFHIELDRHDVILAEGAPSESFVDDDSRMMFHNADEYARLYPDAERVPALYCAPRVTEGFVLEAIRHRLAVRAGVKLDQQAVPLRGFLDQVGPQLVEGWAQNPQHPEAPVCLDVVVDGRVVAQSLANRYRPDLEAAGLGSGRHAFAIRLAVDLTAAQQQSLVIWGSADRTPLARSSAYVEAA